MTTVVLERTAERARTRFGGQKPSETLAVIKTEAKRAAWIYPACYALGAIGTLVVLLSDLPR